MSRLPKLRPPPSDASFITVAGKSNGEARRTGDYRGFVRGALSSIAFAKRNLSRDRDGFAAMALR